MPLSGKQRRHLRALGQNLEPVIHVGKEGVTQECVASTLDAFNTRELIKVRVLKNAPEERNAIADDLAQATHGQVAGLVGFTFLLYKPNKGLKERIVLPRADAAAEQD